MSKPRGGSASTIHSTSCPPLPELRIGTSGWHYSSWRGPFYPSGLAPKHFLAFYAEHFNTAEINYSFYRLPSEQAVRTWRESVPEGFLFAWKVSRFITHLKRLKDVDESIDLVLSRMSGLGPAFGPILFQFPPNFIARPETRDRLARCLDRVPVPRLCACEFRHPSWFEEEALTILRDRNVALCLSDYAPAPTPWMATASFVYIRGHGTIGRYAGHYPPSTLRKWARAIAGWRHEGRSVYVYFDNDAECAAPKDAKALLKLAASAK